MPETKRNQDKGTASRDGDASPEQNLWLATLTLGIRDFIEDSIHRKIETIQAVAWVYSNDTGIGSFDWVCTMVGFDPVTVRKGLVRYRDRYKRAYQNQEIEFLEESIKEEFAMSCRTI